ncbi:MAG: hypothetical protein NC432_03530 [Roseburia sp.]|nr:hypothetical protein [Roseburia sp.]MCM1098414.1 hypothetical protein [Ruminococcus flavefaciens]
MQNLQKAKTGLKKMFIAQIGIFAFTLLPRTLGTGLAYVFLLTGSIPLLVLILVIVFVGLASLILVYIGLCQAGKDIRGFKTSFLLTLFNLPVVVLRRFFGTAVLEIILSLSSKVLGLAASYYLYIPLSRAMEEIGASDEAHLARIAWRIKLTRTFLSAAVLILALFPILSDVTGLVSTLETVVLRAGGAFGLLAFYKCQKAI